MQIKVQHVQDIIENTYAVVIAVILKHANNSNQMGIIKKKQERVMCLSQFCCFRELTFNEGSDPVILFILSPAL